MHTLGSTFTPPPFHAGGLRYHGMAPLVSHCQELGLTESRAYTQTEVFAAGVFYKMLHHPIEETLQGGTPPLLGPENSDRGHNAGVELEARAGLGRLWGHLDRLSVNANATFISSRARLTPKVTMLGTQEHPLQGQADYVLNGGLTYARPDGRMDATVMVSATGRRLRLVGYAPLPDVYEQPVATLDATVNLAAVAGSRVKVSAKNLLDPVIRELQGTHETVSFRRGRSFSIGVSHGL